MQFRPPGRQRRVGRVASISIAAAPFPAFAADVALSPWGTYLFFVIVATIVIVLLLHEALDNHQSGARRHDERKVESFGQLPHETSRFSDDAVAGNDGDRHAA